MMVSKIIMTPLLWIFKRQKQMFFRGQIYFSLRGQQTWKFPKEAGISLIIQFQG